MSDIIQFPNCKNITQPKPVDVLDHVISTLEALQSDSHCVLTAIALLGEEKRAREEAERNAK
jgi:predicted house-cleaning NTP pyrophosphatase (Maf/HAM1 superfamily)